MSTAQANADHAIALCAALAASGVRHVAISPGSRSTPLVLAWEALERAGRATLHVVVDERVAAFIALGIGRAGEPAALVCTSGTAGAHYLPAIIEASQSGVPMIALTADRPAELHDCGANQTVPQHDLFGAFTRRTFRLDAPAPGRPSDHARSTGMRAATVALAPDPGPVHINVAFREPLWEPAVTFPLPAAVDDRGIHLPEPQEAAGAALARICEARRGAIVCGPAVDDGGDEARALSIARLARRLQWPLIADGLSGLRQREFDDVLVSSADGLLRHTSAAEQLRPDLVVHFGGTPTSKTLAHWIADVPTVAVAPNTRWADATHSAISVALGDDARTALAWEQAIARRPARTDADWLPRWIAVEAAVRETIGQACSGDDAWEGAILRAIAECALESPEDKEDAAANTAGLHVGSSMPVRDLDTVATHVGEVTANRGASGIDGTVATALGVSIARPDRGTIVVLGDLAFQHDIGGLIAAAKADLPLTVVVIDNSGGGIFGFLPIADHPAFERLFVAPQPDVEYSRLVRSVGGRVATVATLERLRIALRMARSRHGLDVVVVPVDRATNLHHHRELWTAIARAADAALAAHTPAPDRTGSTVDQLNGATS